MAEKETPQKDRMFELAQKLLSVEDIDSRRKFIKLTEILDKKSEDYCNIPNKLVNTYEVVKSNAYRYNINRDYIDRYFMENVNEFETLIQGFGSTDPKKQKILDFVRKRIDEDSKLKSADFAGKLGITLFLVRILSKKSIEKILPKKV